MHLFTVDDDRPIQRWTSQQEKFLIQHFQQLHTQESKNPTSLMLDSHKFQTQKNYEKKISCWSDYFFFNLLNP